MSKTTSQELTEEIAFRMWLHETPSAMRALKTFYALQQWKLQPVKIQKKYYELASVAISAIEVRMSNARRL